MVIDLCAPGMLRKWIKEKRIAGEGGGGGSLLETHRLIENILCIVNVSGYVNVSITSPNPRGLLSECHRISTNAFVSPFLINMQYSLGWLFLGRLGIMRGGDGLREVSVVGGCAPEWPSVTLLLALGSGLPCPGSWLVVYHRLVEILDGGAELMAMWINFHQLLP